MMIKSLLIFVLFLFCSLNQSIAQSPKKVIDHTVYRDWKTIRGQQFSKNGNWLTYEINPQHRGDGYLYIKNIKERNTDSIPRGSNAKFSPNSNFISFLVKPQADSVRQLRLDGKKRDELPKDSLFIIMLQDMSIEKFANIKSIKTPDKKSDWIAFEKEVTVIEKNDTTKNKNENEKTENQEEKEKDEQENDTEVKESKELNLFIYNPVSGSKHVFKNIENYQISENGKLICMLKLTEDSVNIYQIKVFDTEKKSLQTVFTHEGDAEIKNISIDNEGEQLSFIFSPDNDKNDEPKVFSLYFWKDGQNEASVIVDKNTFGIPRGWSVGEHGNISFSDSGERIFFGTAPVPEKEEKDSLLSDEKYQLDIWHWQDPLIQPEQLVRKETELQRTYMAVYHIKDKKTVQLADENVPFVRTINKGDGDIALGHSNLPYQLITSWSAKHYRDYYFVDIKTGDRKPALEKNLFYTNLSPDGKFLLYYHYRDSAWYSISTDKYKKTKLSGEIPYEFYNILNDRPQEPSPYGIAAWIENDAFVLIYDHFDIWKICPHGKKDPVNLTGAYGRKNNIRFRYLKLDDDRDYIKRREDIILSAFNYQNKQSGFYRINVNRPGTPEKLTMEDAHIYGVTKAADKDILMWRKSTFTDFPDIWLSDALFNDARCVTNANPQQTEYRWGNVELVEWISFSNDTLQGLLYTPEDLDPDKKYPMIVYFYERSSDGIHRHFIPSPSRSTINRSHYVSNNYVIFVPDINPYIIGYPGQTAYNSIISGTKAMLNRYEFIDGNNIGIQGQSWGGYQIAYLITRTDMFKAAMAGTPVSNMFSAYGGIRWSSGKSRQFQYEETQSRIGGTPWEKHLRYVENSPIFYADRINTPLLIMHNDDDGAVPWYQGIELYLALRRLQQPVWLLNYNDEGHNLRNWPSRMDLDIRMKQFFDHYLKNEPAPVWLEHGIPAVEKGKNDGYRPAKSY